jgi:hypothetical protein
MASWRMTPCSFGGTCCPQYSEQKRFVLKMEAACHFETLPHICNVPPRRIRQERRFIVLVPTRGLSAGLSSPVSCAAMSVPMTVLFGQFGRTFVRVFNFEFLSLYTILCSMLYTFYIISHCDFLGTPLFSLCVSLSGTLSYLCISLSGTPSCLVHLLTCHPFLPFCYPFHNVPFPSNSV